MQPSAVCVALAWLPLSAHAGLTLHLQGNWVPGMLRAIDPPAAPALSQQHLSESSPKRILRIQSRAVAIDARTFVANGVHYRLAGAEALPAGSAEEAQARAALQRELDSGAVTLRVYVVE